MFNHFQTGGNQCSLGTLNHGVIDEWGTHWVFQAVFVNSKNYESDCGSYHRSSYWLRELILKR
jgi:hypothetical protein